MSEFSAKYWRNRAAATAAMADRRWIDEKQKFKLLRVALEYDKLADAAAAKGQPEAEQDRFAPKPSQGIHGQAPDRGGIPRSSQSARTGG
jgi:hypothetical protein